MTVCRHEPSRSAATTSLHGTAHPDTASMTSSAVRAESSSRHAENARAGSAVGAGNTTVTVVAVPGTAASSTASAAGVPGSTNPAAHERSKQARSTLPRARSTTERCSSRSPVVATYHAPSRFSTARSAMCSVVVMAAVMAHAALSVRPKCGTPGNPTSARPRTRTSGVERHTG